MQLLLSAAQSANKILGDKSGINNGNTGKVILEKTNEINGLCFPVVPYRPKTLGFEPHQPPHMNQALSPVFRAFCLFLANSIPTGGNTIWSVILQAAQLLGWRSGLISMLTLLPARQLFEVINIEPAPSCFLSLFEVLS